MENKINCENCAWLDKINKKPIYAICHKQNVVYELWQKNAKNYVCKDFKALSKVE